MEVGDIMALGAATVHRDSSIAEALRLMLEHRISGLPVTDADGALVGVVSEADFVGRPAPGSRPVDILVAGGQGVRALDTRKVEEIMSPDPVAIAPGASLEEAIQVMEKRGVKRLPVVRDGKVVGILSRADLLRGLLRKHRMA